MKKIMVAVFAAVVQTSLANAGELTVDFSKPTRDFRRALHSSGLAPKITSVGKTFEDVKSFNFEYSRTHDHALVNPGQRIVDTHFIFPLMHHDAKDPRNYYFKPTDFMLEKIQDAGMKVFYRLGTSIEHSGTKRHFNSVIPEDFAKTAEVYAGIIRHYTKGWADGFNWDIKYWEIWNEPDIHNCTWCFPDDYTGPKSDTKRRELFIDLFITCLKRLKSEFPDVKVGGPALAIYRDDYFTELLKACKAAGVAPDFISWHYYDSNPVAMVDQADKARKLCDSFGFTDCELILNEWHYLGPYQWGGLRNTDPAVVKKVWSGPGSHNGIDSSCFTLSALSRIQFSELDQAHFYGCGHIGAWGYMDAHKEPYKIYHALKLFGSIATNCVKLCESPSTGGVGVMTLAGLTADGKGAWLLVTDYLGTDATKEKITVNVKGVKKVVSATVLDHERDNEAVDVDFTAGRLTLKKKLPGSAAFLVKFER